MFSILRNSISDQGIRSIYTGLSASLMRQMSYSLVRIGSYEEMKRRMSANGQPSTGKLLLAAGAAGGLGGIAGNPAGLPFLHCHLSLGIKWFADIILVRMTSDSIRPPETRYNYRNGITGLISLVKDEGAKNLGRGLGTNAVCALSMSPVSH